MRSVVVLPQPEGPSSVTNSPVSMVSDTPRNNVGAVKSLVQIADLQHFPSFFFRCFSLYIPGCRYYEQYSAFFAQNAR